VWFHLAEDVDRWRALEHSNEPSGFVTVGEFLTSWATFSLSDLCAMELIFRLKLWPYWYGSSYTGVPHNPELATTAAGNELVATRNSCRSPVGGFRVTWDILLGKCSRRPVLWNINRYSCEYPCLRSWALCSGTETVSCVGSLSSRTLSVSSCA
jgi:hypothetical protein